MFPPIYSRVMTELVSPPTISLHWLVDQKQKCLIANANLPNNIFREADLINPVKQETQYSKGTMLSSLRTETLQNGRANRSHYEHMLEMMLGKMRARNGS